MSHDITNRNTVNYNDVVAMRKTLTGHTITKAVVAEEFAKMIKGARIRECPECGELVKKTEKECPYCGRKLG